MESNKEQILELISKGLNGDDIEEIIIALKQAKVSSESKSTIKNSASRYSKEDLKLKSLKFYAQEIDLHCAILANGQATYRKLGHFDYGVAEEDMVEIKKWTGEYDGKKAIYFGEINSETEEFNNIGILVYVDGDIEEGFWMNGNRQGPGRYIHNDGSYFIGESKAGFFYDGEYFKKDGTLLSTWKDGIETLAS